MIDMERPKLLRRVIAITNGKGGVGKTSTTTNAAGYLASWGYKTLVIDLDAQGNCGLDLGYANNDEISDNGENLYRAIVEGADLVPVKKIRENLDVIPGGTRLNDIAPHLVAKALSGNSFDHALAESLSPIANRYDVILIDCPPGEAMVQLLALNTAKWVLIPTAADEGSLEGLSIVAERVQKARAANPALEVLGVVRFALDIRATTVHKDLTSDLQEIMGTSAPVFDTYIRYSQRTAVDSRRRGQLLSELASDASKQDKFAHLRNRNNDINSEPIREKIIGPSADSLAKDYFNLAVQIVEQLNIREEQIKSKVGA